MKILTVTGYKPMELNIYRARDPRIIFIKEAIKKRLISFIEDGLEWVLISGQMGVELWTAEVVLDLKDTYDIQIGMMPAFEEQANRWPEVYKFQFEELMLSVDYFHPIYKGEYKGPFQFRARDLWLTEKSNGCLLLMDEEFPGSVKYFYDVAKSVENYPIYYVTPMDIDDTVEEMRLTDPERFRKLFNKD